MNPTVAALTGYIAWFLVLLMLLGVTRVAAVATGKRAPNSFRPDGTDVSPFAARVTRAHANCYESFPFIGGTLLLALATGSTAVTNSMALIVLACRVGQSMVHLASTSVMAVNIRFALFLVQVLIAVCWITRITGQVLGS